MSRCKPLPSFDELNRLLRYDPASGNIYWLVGFNNLVKPGDLAGTKSTCGYITIRFKSGGHARAHRIAFKLMTGRDPFAQIDHINGNRSDNRWVNLREATNAENMQNVGRNSRNTSGFTGVSWRKSSGKWVANIRKNYRLHHLGCFATAESAHEAYLAAKAKMHQFQPVAR